MLISLEEKRSLEFRGGRPWNMPCVSDVPPLSASAPFSPHGPSLLTSLWEALLLGH